MTARSETRRWPLLTPGVVHVATLIAGFVVLVVLGRGQWFVNDDWTILALTDPMRSHGGHWNTAATLLFGVLFKVFGLTTYLPYLIPAIIAHLATIHVAWRLVLRVGVSPWLATLGASTVVLFGAAAENVMWAFQVGFMGALALSLGALLLIDRARLTLPVAIGAGVLAAASLPFASTALPVLAAAGIVGIIRHGWWRTIAVFAPAGLIYLTWFLVVREPSPDILAPHGIQFLTAVPVFFVVVITAAYGQWAGPLAAGPLIAIGVVIWLVATRREWFGRRALGYALLVGVVIFALLTSLTRGGMVIHAAAAERYVYVVVIMSLPVLLLILDRLWREAGVARIAATFILAAVAVVNAQLLYERALLQAGAEGVVRADLAAAVEVVGDDPDLPDLARPVLEGAPDITVEVLRRWIDDDIVPDFPYDEANLERVRYFLQITGE